MTNLVGRAVGADVVVVGAGVVGAACAEELVSRGLSVVVLDRGSFSSATSAACEGNVLVSDKTNPAEVGLAHWSRSLFDPAVRRLEEVLPGLGNAAELQAKGGVIIAGDRDELAALRETTRLQRGLGTDVEDLDGADVAELEPAAGSCAGGAFYPQDAQVHPTRFALALLSSAKSKGARLIAHAEVHGPALRRRGTLCGVSAGGRRFHADAVVNATGPWAGDLAQRFGLSLPISPRRGVVLVALGLPTTIRHKVYEASYGTAVEGRDRSGCVVSGVVEQTRSGTVLVGSSREFDAPTGAIGHSVMAELARRAVRLVPPLERAQVVRAYGGWRPASEDGLPIIGPDPRLPGLLHATGHEGAGVGLSLATAAAIADAITGEPSPVDMSAFRVDREVQSHGRDRLAV